MKLFNYLELSKLRPPELICFDHLYSEYRSIKNKIPGEDIKFIEDLEAKARKQEKAVRVNSTKDRRRSSKEDGGEAGPDGKPILDKLTWDELYSFELILSEYMPADRLKSKIVRLRSDFNSIASPKEYAEYLASKPPELQAPPDAEDQHDKKAAEITRLMRADLKDLLGRIYLKYAILPIRETRLTDLTLFAANLCLLSLAILLVILLFVFLVPLIAEIMDARTASGAIKAFQESASLSSLTIFVVVVVGAMGGFVSALQRIQTRQAEGDSMYNLSLLFYGSKSVFVAPITGAIFAIVLYLMFAAGILQGTFFPIIYTPPTDEAPKEQSSTSTTPTPTPDSSQTAKNTTDTPEKSKPTSEASNSNGSTPEASPSPQPTQSPTSAQSGTPTPSPAPSPTPAPFVSVAKDVATNKGLNVFEFLAKSGPVNGQSYALLIIWCFIAGFAERFVPDALDRLISNSKSGEKK